MRGSHGKRALFKKRRLHVIGRSEGEGKRRGHGDRTKIQGVDLVKNLSGNLSVSDLLKSGAINILRTRIQDGKRDRESHPKPSLRHVSQARLRRLEITECEPYQRENAESSKRSRIRIDKHAGDDK